MSCPILSKLLVFVSLLVLFSTSCNALNKHPLKACKFNAIYQFGDSISNTGNLVLQSPLGAGYPFAHLPYGETRRYLFNNSSTGRCSNGLLMTDFIAKAAGLPFLEPYLSRHQKRFNHGVNFAVATALTSRVLGRKNIVNPVTNSSLMKQLHWMITHFNATCQHDHHDCVEKRKSALFLVGEIGLNDYNYAFFEGKSMEEVKSIVPDVIKQIKYAVKVVIRHGEKRVIVPGILPIGCLPIYLTAFQTNDSAAYDELHCLKGLNKFATEHNDRLQRAIKELRQGNPNVIIVYGDHYNAFQSLYRFARKKIDETTLQKACCGKGGDYNFSITKMCGFEGASVCAYPHKRISWDGVHLTERAYFIMASSLVSNILPQLQCVA